MRERKHYRLARSGAIFRADVDQEQDTIDFFVWNFKEGTWEPSMRLLDYMLDQDPDLEDLPDSQVPSGEAAGCGTMPTGRPR